MIKLIKKAEPAYYIGLGSVDHYLIIHNVKFYGHYDIDTKIFRGEHDNITKEEIDILKINNFKDYLFSKSWGFTGIEINLSRFDFEYKKEDL